MIKSVTFIIINDIWGEKVGYVLVLHVDLAILKFILMWEPQKVKGKGQEDSVDMFLQYIMRFEFVHGVCNGT